MRNHAIFVSQKLSVVGQQLGGHSLVELMTVNKVLLRRQPKPLNYFGNRFFFCFKFANFDFACFNFDVFVLQVSRFRGCCGEGEIA